MTGIKTHMATPKTSNQCHAPTQAMAEDMGVCAQALVNKRLQRGHFYKP